MMSRAVPGSAARSTERRSRKLPMSRATNGPDTLAAP